MAYINFVKGSNWDELVREGITVVDVYNDNCGPCKMLEPVFEKLSNEITDVKFIKVKLPDAINMLYLVYGVKVVPTILLMKDGVLIDQKIGFIPEPVFKDWILTNK